MARPDQPIFTVTEISVAVARAQVPEAEAAQVRPGQPCRFEPSDMPGWSFAGRISVINEAVDPARRTVETWCEIPNPGRTLNPGEFGHAVIVVAEAPGSIVVPAAAVQFEEGSSRGVVFIARSGAAVRRAVRTGIVSGDRVQILEGVREGEPVILEGAYGLEDGTRIRVREAQGK
jgi:Cu(I)/Ag(I) efflux system membrane fusion protein